MKSLKYVTLATLSLFVLILCTGDKNPYLVSTDSGVRITSASISDGDTVSIFSSESLTLVLHLKEYLDRIVLRTPANRLWSGSDTVITSDQFDREPFTFRFSLYDTGWQEISITARRTTGDTVEEDIRIYARSPLHQTAIRAGVGDTVLLSTPPVRDDAQYVWDFRDGTVIRNNSPQVSYIVKTPLTTGVGEVYVSDHSFRSPSVHFTVVDQGAHELLISSLNDSLNGDTVYAGDANFTLSVAVIGAASILTATVNGVQFDRAVKDNSGAFVFSKLFGGLDTRNGAVRATVAVTDGAGVTAERTFWIVYSRSVPRSDRPTLVVLFPSKDSLTANAQSFTISGYAANRAGFDSLAVFLQVGDSLHPHYLRFTADSAWQWTFDLAPGWNPIAVMAFEDTSRQGDTLAIVRRAVKYAPGAPDTIPPQLIALLGNGAPLRDGLITADPRLSVRAEIMDNGALASVSINNAPATVDSVVGWYGADVTLTHRLAGTAVRVRAIDSAGNKLDTAVTVYLDMAPAYTQIPLTARIPADSLFSAEIGVVDPDGDPVSLTAVIHRSRGDTLLQLGNARLFAWLPAAADTGWRTIDVRAWDGYVTADTTFTVYVSPASVKSVPVRFLTKPTDLPDSLVAAHDTLRLVLRVDPVSGTPPMRFSARVVGGPVLLDASDSAVVVWTPASGDTGVRRLELIVRDSLGFADTIQALVTVAPAPRVSVLFEKTGSSGPESVSPVTIRVRLSGPARTTVTAAYDVDWTKSTADSTDFDLPANRTLVFNPGDTARDIVLSIVNDTLVENSEKVVLSLTTMSSGAVIGVRSAFTHTIINDDFTLQVTISPAGSGTVVRTVNDTTNQGPYQAGTTVSLKALPAAGYRVGSWSGTVTATTDPAVVNVRIDSNMSVGVLFAIAAPVITSPPLSQTAMPGTTATFSVTATGVQLSYRWQKNSGNISGATTSSYTTPAVSLADNGAIFRCIVSNSAGSVTSSTATLAVSLQAPVITGQPRDTTVDDGRTAFFAVTVTGTGLTFQWSKNTVPIPGATAAGYTTPAAARADSGALFQCVVANSAGSVTSTSAVLSVRRALPAITTQPHSQTVTDGDSAMFGVVASGTQPLSYQWFRNDTVIAGAEANSYTITQAIASLDGTRYHCQVSNSAGSVTSVDALLTVNQPAGFPKISISPQPDTVAAGGTATFTVRATGGKNLTYQWQLVISGTATNIAGATGSTYTFSPVLLTQNGELYQCVVTNAEGSVTSAAALLTVQ